mgnify:CR=1 FL=1
MVDEEDNNIRLLRRMRPHLCIVRNVWATPKWSDGSPWWLVTIECPAIGTTRHRFWAGFFRRIAFVTDAAERRDDCQRYHECLRRSAARRDPQTAGCPAACPGFVSVNRVLELCHVAASRPGPGAIL